MRCKIAAILISALMFLSVALIAMDSDGSRATATDYTLNGYVYNGQTSPVTAIKNATVEIFADDVSIGTEVTDAEGMFTFTGIDTKSATKFTLIVYQPSTTDKYGIINAPSEAMSPTTDRTIWNLNFTQMLAVDPNTYTIGSSALTGIIVGPPSNLEGYAYDSSTWTGVAGATAYLYGNGSISLGTADTDSNGCFKFEGIVIAGWSEITLTIKKGDVPYAIKCAEYGMTKKTVPSDDTVWAIDFSKLPKTGDTYYIGDENGNGLVTAAASGKITFKVVDKNDKGLYHAYVSLNSGTTVLATGYTDGDGEFTTKTIPYGDNYDLVVTCNGFEKYESKINFNTETTEDLAVKMAPKDMITFYGMTTYHIMMFAAVITGMFLVMISYTLVARKWGGMSEN